MNRANHKMIQLARESRGYTQTELAEKMDILQGNFSRMENGEIGIKEEHLVNLAKILNYPIDFFYMQRQVCTTDTHYRKRTSIDQKTKLKAEALMNIYKFNVEDMLKSLEIINNVPVLTDPYDSPEKIAQYVRSYWKIPKGAIEDLTKVIEDNGIIIIQVDFGTERIDGRTIITDTGHPVIFLNSNVPGDRQRLTLAHELGHVVMHVNSVPKFAKDEDEEAFVFASEFLMPFAECEYDLNDKLSLEKLAELKRKWRISMQAILYRAQKREMVNYNRCRYLWSQFNAKGWKTVEPIEIPRERPSIIDRMIHLFITKMGYTKEGMAKLFRLKANDLDDKYFKPQGKLRIA